MGEVAKNNEVAEEEEVSPFTLIHLFVSLFPAFFCLFVSSIPLFVAKEEEVNPSTLKALHECHYIT